MRVTLTGNNTYALSSELKKLVQEFTATHSDLAVEQIDGGEATQSLIQEALSSLPFLASRKLVVLHDISLNSNLAGPVPLLLESSPETTDVIFVEPHIDKRTSLFKYLKKETDFREFKELDQSSASQWLVDFISGKEGSLTRSNASYLVEKVGLDQERLFNEASKLLLYNPEINRESIDLLIEGSPQSTIFELLEASFSGNRKRIAELYSEQRQQRVEPQQIIAMLTWQLHVIAIIQSAGDRAQEAIAKDAKLNPFVVNRSKNLANRLSTKQVNQLTHELLDLDIKSKSRIIDLDDGLEHYLLALS